MSTLLHKVRRMFGQRALPLLLAAILGALLPARATSGRDDAPKVLLPQRHREFLTSHCVKCHNAKHREGNIRLDDLALRIDDVATAERWQKVLNVLNSGEMPPEEEPQPNSDEKLAVLESLSNAMVAARRALSDPGRVRTIRRLNRREYVNTVQELLGVKVDASRLPSDAGTGKFDTVGASLYFSSDQFEQYLAIAREALDRAIILEGSTRPKPMSVRTEAEQVARRRVRRDLETMMVRIRKSLAWKATGGKRPPSDFGLEDERAANYNLTWHARYTPIFERYLNDPLTGSGALLTDYYPNLFEFITIPDSAPPGRYRLRVRAARTSENVPVARCFVELGNRVSRYESTILKTFQVSGTLEDPQTLVFEVTVDPVEERRARWQNPRSFTLCERSHPSRAARLDAFWRVLKNNRAGRDPALWIDWVEWEGPLIEEWPPRHHQRIFDPPPLTVHEGSDDHARYVLRRFAARAFRDVEPEPAYLDSLVRLYRGRRAAGESFREAIKTPLAVILASSRFLYLAESGSEAKTDAQGRTRLGAREFAARLAYFLWSAPPDKTLLNDVHTGRLRDAAVVRRHVRRMISDEKAFAFVTGFTHQWLSMERLDFFEFNAERFPRFDGSVKRAAREEVYHTFAAVLRENLPVGVLLESDFVVVNSLLATYYGVDGVTGDEFRKVRLQAGTPRGGLLGMAAILAMGSDGERTSPVERGAWVLRKLLNDPPPPAPPNVPQISRFNGSRFSTRSLLSAHQEQPQCAQCHRKIDPIGLGLENFDAVGLWRAEEVIEGVASSGPSTDARTIVGTSKSVPIDPSGQLPDGTKFASFRELRSRIAGQRARFARGLTEALLVYGLGRPLSFLDEPLVDSVLKETQRDGYRLADMIHAIVQSEEFQAK